MTNHFTTDRLYVLRNGVSYCKADSEADAKAVCEALNLFECTPGVIARRLEWANEAERVLRGIWNDWRNHNQIDDPDWDGYATLSRVAKLINEQMPEPCKAEGKYGQCELRAGHDGSHKAHGVHEETGDGMVCYWKEPTTAAGIVPAIRAGQHVRDEHPGYRRER